MERFRAGGAPLILLWWAFMLSGLLMIGAVVLVAQALGFGGVLPVATTIGVLAGLVQTLGLLRWVYLVPSLARAQADPQATPAQLEATTAVFRAFHQYLGVGVGEHLGYLLTGLWSILLGIAVTLGDTLAAWLGWPGIVIGAGLAVSSAEFLGPNEERGWALAGGGDSHPVHRVVHLAARPGDRPRGLSRRSPTAKEKRKEAIVEGVPAGRRRPARGWLASDGLLVLRSRCCAYTPGFSQTETCLRLSLVNGSRFQSPQRSRNVIPAICAMRSSSDGHT